MADNNQTEVETKKKGWFASFGKSLDGGVDAAVKTAAKALVIILVLWVILAFAESPPGSDMGSFFNVKITEMRIWHIVVLVFILNIFIKD